MAPFTTDTDIVFELNILLLGLPDPYETLPPNRLWFIIILKIS